MIVSPETRSASKANEGIETVPMDFTSSLKGSSFVSPSAVTRRNPRRSSDACSGGAGVSVEVVAAIMVGVDAAMLGTLVMWRTGFGGIARRKAWAAWEMFTMRTCASYMNALVRRKKRVTKTNIVTDPATVIRCMGVIGVLREKNPLGRIFKEYSRSRA